MTAAFSPGLRASERYSERRWWFIYRDNRLLVEKRGDAIAVPCVDDPSAIGVSVVRSHHIGSIGEIPCSAAEIAEGVAVPGTMELRGLRDVIRLFSEDLFTAASFGFHIVDWDRTSRYCGRCATPMSFKSDERARECPSCGLVCYPRISPAIIVAVQRDDWILLARAHRHPAGMYSVLAGFVEPAETLEQCVAREVREEVGIEVADVRYFGSQPWPFPNSLMVGFTAEHRSGEICIDAAEIADAQWFSPSSLPRIPGSYTIARRLIDATVGRINTRG